MNSQCTSLRALVNDWFGQGERFRVTRPDRSRTMPWRVVRVEVLRSSGALAIVFFRHGDGSWCVYPPPMLRPTANWL
jgi:hypothetical protein